MLNFYQDASGCPYPFVHKKMFERLKDNFHQEAFEKIRSDSSKLRTYALFKNEVGFEQYLTDMKNVQERILVTKFRLSNHRLKSVVMMIRRKRNGFARFVLRL